MTQMWRFLCRLFSSGWKSLPSFTSMHILDFKAEVQLSALNIDVLFKDESYFWVSWSPSNLILLNYKHLYVPSNWNKWLANVPKYIPYIFLCFSVSETSSWDYLPICNKLYIIIIQAEKFISRKRSWNFI